MWSGSGDTELHKTLPSLTQTAILHVQGDMIDREKLERYLKIYQTSSPSYVFLASMENCIRYMDGPGAVRNGAVRGAGQNADRGA